MTASNAFFEGRQAGQGLISPSLNPYPPGSPAFAEWERGRFAVVLERLGAANAEVERRRARLAWLALA